MQINLSLIVPQTSSIYKMVNQWVLLSVYVFSFLIGLPANLLAICTFYKKLRDKPSPNDVLLFNLTVSDLLFLIFLPFKMYEAARGMKWYLPQTLCSISSYVFFTTIYTSSLLLMAIGVNRYLGLAFPFKYRQRRRPKYATAGSVLIWLISASHCSIVFITVHMQDTNGTANGNVNGTTPKNVCYEEFTNEQKKVLLPMRLEFFVVLFTVPLVVCVFCYINCIYILHTRPHITKEKKQRAIGMALCTLSIFLLCFLPYNTSHLIGYSSNKSPEWRYYTLLLSTLNTCLDPIIFYFSSSTFRDKTRMSFLKVIHIRQWKPKETTAEMSNVTNCYPKNSGTS